MAEELLLLNRRGKRARDTRGRFVKKSRSRSNPKRRRSSGKKTYRKRARRAVARIMPTRRRARRNPRNVVTMLVDSIVPAGIAGAGAIAVDVALAFLPLPVQMKAGPVRYLTRAGVAVGLGMLTGMVARQSTASLVTAGGLTVVAYDLLRDALRRFAPQIPLGEYDTYDAGDGLGYTNYGWTLPPAGAGEGGNQERLGAYYGGDGNGAPDLGAYYPEPMNALPAMREPLSAYDNGY